MGINFAAMYKRFENTQSKLRKAYINAGMTEEQSRAIYEFDKWQMNRDLAYYRRSISIEEYLEKDEKRDDDTKNSPFLSQLTYEMKESEEGKFWWIDQIEDERICTTVKNLSEEDKTILDLFVYQGYNQTEIARLMGICQAKVCRRIKSIFSKFK